MASLNERFYKSAGRHFATLSCVQVPPGSNEENALVFSGFLVDIAGAWVYVTAGHILRDIKRAIAGGSTFSTWRLGDHTSRGKFRDIAIPFDFKLDDWLVIEDESMGIDYAAVSLHPMYCRLLEAGGATPIESHAWGDHLTEHEQWALVGVPSETVEYDGKTILTARVLVAPLEPAEAPAGAGAKAENQFYARLKDDSTGIVEDIDGMSGGPIFALKLVDGQWRYHVIGVQSGWYPTAKIICACPFSSFGTAMKQAVDEALSELPD